MSSLRPYQLAGKEALRALYRAGKRRCVYQLATGGGKCLGLDTPVLMHNGTVRPVQEIKVGDDLIGPDSLQRRVVSTCVGYGPLFKVTPTRGDPYIVNEDHILSLKRTETGVVVNTTVREFLAANKSFRHLHKGWHAAVDFSAPTLPLALDPYYLGVWLGDGDSSGGHVTTGDQEIKDWVIWYAGSVGCKAIPTFNSENSEHINVSGEDKRDGNPILWALRHYRLIRNKHIPAPYKRASRDVRLQLLAGIIDTDGHYGGKGFDIILKNKRLADDVVFVARSLGFWAYVRECKKMCHNNGVVGTYYRFNINGPVDKIPTKIARKQAAPRRQKKNPLVMGLTITPIGDGDYYGFELAGPDGHFLLGDFTVTHNTKTACSMIGDAIARGRSTRVVVHRIELVEQFEAALAGAGIDGVPVSMAQTLTRRLDRTPAPDLVVIDECHHATSETWARIIRAWPDAWVLGLTATPARTDGRGLGEIFDGLVCGPSMRQLMDQGYLARYRLYAPPAPDTSGLRKRAGDYTAESLSAVFDRPQIVGDVVAHYQRYGGGRQFVAFGVSVDHACNIAAGFQKSGVSCEVLHGKMTAPDRKRIVQAVKCGALTGIANCDIVSEGFDVPAIGCVILAGRTLSLIRYLQRIGRGLRPDGDRAAVILDHGGNVFIHGMPDQPREWSLDGVAKKAGRSEVVIRHCPECFAVFAGHLSACPYCGYAVERKIRTLRQQDGELIEVSYWADAPVSAAQTIDDLRAIAAARGYHRGWVFHKAKEALKMPEIEARRELGWWR